ncbi:MAG: tetraacyldisaccharide 4'-kinase [Hyphomicrobiaceae bacterium]
MLLEEPKWWYKKQQANTAQLLRPLGWVVAMLARRRLETSQTAGQVPIPVLCVGNFVAGGTGKTPLARCVADFLKKSGYRPAFLTRGYGGKLRGPHIVKADADKAVDIGDEAILLARTGPTVVARDRLAGAQFIVANDLGDTIVMDDGLQNPTLKKDLTIAVVDHSRGIGNGLVIPAGPLRARLADQLAVTDVLVVNMGTGAQSADEKTGDIDRCGPWWGPFATFRGPKFAVSVVPEGSVTWLRGLDVVAYAGIANPQRFYELVRDLGGKVVATRSFPDHHNLSEIEANTLLDLAKSSAAQLVTTEKDFARLSRDCRAQRKLADQSRVLAISSQVAKEQEQDFAMLLAKASGGANYPLDRIG